LSDRRFIRRTIGRFLCLGHGSSRDEQGYEQVWSSGHEDASGKL